MKSKVLVEKILLLAVLIGWITGTSNAQDFLIHKSWDFENWEIGHYTDDMVREDFNAITLFSHNSADIVEDRINRESTNVMRITHPANTLSNGFEMIIDLEAEYDEVYASFNWKFSEEYNSTAGGKFPGFRGMPRWAAAGFNCPQEGDGFLAANMYKYANSLITYHYDHTKGVCPWAYENYDYDTIFMNNGNWYNITQRILMNTFTNGVANADGIRELWVDGRLVFQLTNLILMETESPSMKIDAFILWNFYGGNTESYIPKTECYGYIDNLKIYSSLQDPVNGHEVHNPQTILQSPNEIIDRELYYDALITDEGVLQNGEYGNNYSSCIDEVYTIDAGEENTVTFTWDHTIGGGDFLFFYDGNRTDSRLIKVVPGYSSKTNQTVKSSGRHLTIRFSTNTDVGTTGWKGIVSFNSDTSESPDPSPAFNNPPTIENQQFVVDQQEFSGNFIGRIETDEPDEGQQLTYTIEEGNESDIFFLEPGTGDLSTTTSEVFDLAELEHNLLIKVEDDGEIPKSATANVNVVFVKNTPTYYIDPDNKNDALEDGSKEHPFDSWTDVIWENGYNYLQKRGSVANVPKISVYANNVMLGAYGKGSTPKIISNSNETAIKLFNKNNVIIENLHIVAEQAISCIYILGEESDLNRIKNCSIEGSENGIRVIDGNSIEICYNIIKNCSDAIYSYAEDNKIYYNVFKFNINAINITSSLSNSEIYNNVFYENSTGVSNSYSDLTLQNNIFYLASAGDVAINQKLDELLSDNNIFYPEREGFIAMGDNVFSSLSDFQEEKGLDLNSFSQDPLFVDVYSDNFRLEDNSPGIDGGADVEIEQDFIGNQVPQGGAPDIGIIEKIANGITSISKLFTSENKNDFLIYPNPTGGHFKVVCKNVNDQSAKLQIKDMNAKTVYEKSCIVQNHVISQTINIPELPSGVYVVLLQSANTIYSQRITRSNL